LLRRHGNWLRHVAALLRCHVAALLRRHGKWLQEASVRVVLPHGNWLRHVAPVRGPTWIAERKRMEK
jgi:hypothetical protein